jgi:hypothetical protein
MKKIMMKTNSFYPIYLFRKRGVSRATDEMTEKIHTRLQHKK